jgi:acetyl esterase/lipase
MRMPISFVRGLARALGLLTLGAGALAHYRVKSAALDPGLLAYAGKSAAQAAAPGLTLLGAAAVAGILGRDPLALAAGTVGALLLGRYTRDVLAAVDGLNQVFGPGWQARIPPERAARLLPRRWSPYTATPRGANCRQDLVFWQIPAGPAAPVTRTLLCDLWQPPQNTPRTGLGIIYFHAGGWQNFDKDTGTRPFFKHLAGLGHVVMDVSYRLCDETDLAGMLGDVRRAVAWLKAQGPAYGVDPAHIVLAGASAGGQLALLAAYAPDEAQSAPSDLAGADTSVAAVISYYGPPDMLRFGAGPAHPDWPAFVRWGRRIGIVTPQAYLEWPNVERRLFGALAHEVPEIAARFSPISHVRSDCPPTLLIHGSHDRVVNPADARDLYAALRRAGAPVAYLELPRVDHAFDLVAPQISASAQTALYTVERFLECVRA